LPLSNRRRPARRKRPVEVGIYTPPSPRAAQLLWRNGHQHRSANRSRPVHDLFVISGRSDLGCNIAPPDFLPAGNPSPAAAGIRN